MAAVVNKAKFTINASPSGALGFVATSGQVLTLQLENALGVLSVRFEVYNPADSSSPLASSGAPQLAFTANSLPAITPAVASSAVTIAAAIDAVNSHAWNFRATADLGNGKFDVYERLVVLRNGKPRNVIPGEMTQFGARGWADAWTELLNYVIAGVPFVFGVPFVDPAEYGAVGNGVANDSAALLLAIAAGVAAGKPVYGFGRTYGISGNLTLVAGAWLQDIAFKQLTPAAGTVRTLTSAGGSKIKLVRVTVNRNGTGSAGVHQVDAGIHIEGGSNHYFESVEVYGDDIGSGFVLSNVTDSEAVGIYVHDIKYLLGADPGNDRVQGIWLTSCTRVRLRGCRANDIGGNFGSGYTLRWSRGYCFNGNTEVSVAGCRSRMVDQGYDTTGSVGNSRFQFSDSFAIDCLTYGFKFANTARDGQVDNCTAERCALSGFIVSGPSGSGMTAVASSDIQFTDCVAYDTGATGLPGGPVAGGKIGFRADNGGFDPDTTLGIRFVGCKALDRQAVRTMSNGFETDIAAPISGNYNECVNCVVVGNLGAAFSNMHVARCEVTRAAVQSIPSNAVTWTTVDWTADVDLGAMHDNVVNSANVYTRREGNYRSTWGVTFAANATGQRGVRIVRNGTPIPGTTVLEDAAAAGETALQVSWTSGMGVGDNLRIEVFQNSGGAINLQTTSGGVVEQVS